MREYIRHPSDIPIKYHIRGLHPDITADLNNISHGGLCFCSENAVIINSFIIINFPVINPKVTFEGVVAWCHPINEVFDVGVKFLDKDSGFRVRLIEEICHIEHYRRMVSATEGRNLTGEQAAVEWIEKFASDFPPV